MQRSAKSNHELLMLRMVCLLGVQAQILHFLAQQVLLVSCPRSKSQNKSAEHMDQNSALASVLLIHESVLLTTCIDARKLTGSFVACSFRHMQA